MEMKLTEMYHAEKLEENLVIQESVNFSNADAKNAIRYLQNAMRSVGASNDKYAMLAFVIAAGLLPTFNYKMKDVWGFLNFFAQNASKGTGFRMNSDVEKELKKQYKIK